MSNPITPISKACKIYTQHQEDFEQVLNQTAFSIKSYIVPISRNNSHLQVIIQSTSPEKAYQLIAYQLIKEEFSYDRWIVNPDYNNYKTL